MRVWVIEDSEDLAQLIRLVLQTQSKENVVTLTTTGFDNLLFLREDNLPEYDAAVVDLMLPGASGVEIARLLKRYRPDKKVIVFTAAGDMNSPTVKLAAIEADAVVQKGGNVKEILTALGLSHGER